MRRFWFLGVIAVIAIGAFVFRDRLMGSAVDLQVGDCFDIPAETEQIEEVQHHPCNESHTAEVILVYDHASDTYPTEDQFFEQVEQRCFPAFADYTGSGLLDQETYDIYWFYPHEDGWGRGDHEVVCSVYRLDEGSMTQSVRGSNPT